MGKVSGVVALIGAVVAMIGVFLTWLGDGIVSITGWDIFTNWDGIFDLYFAPLAVLGLGVLALVAAGWGITGKGGAGSRILLAIAGLGMIALPALLLYDFTSLVGVTIMDLFDAGVLGMGFFMSIGGGLLVLISAALP
jgi:hypothetical protein